MRNFRTLWFLPLLLLLAFQHLPLAQPAAGKLRSTETEHYLFQSDCEPAVHDEYARVIEAAWQPMKEFFGAEPRLKKGERLKVYFFEKEPDWAEQIRKDGAAVPSGAGGYYWPTSRSVYLWRQPTVYYSRQLLIHEVIHQFHFLARCNNTGPKDTWYTEGIAEYLSRHMWDGQTLTLGALPLISQENYAEQALQIFGEKDYDFKAFVFSERQSARPEQWAFVRYLHHAEKGAIKKKWEQIARRLDQGESSRNIFKSVFGDPKALGTKVHEWLKTEQEPFKPVFLEWEGVAPGVLKGWSGVTTLCRTSGDAASLSASLQVPPGDWIGGLLLHFESTSDYTVALVKSSGTVSINRRVQESWKVLHSAAAPARQSPDRLSLKAERGLGGVTFTVDGVSFGPFDLPGRKLGLCLENCNLTFSDVTWK
ncbi:hypothetical protein EDM80_07750 [bacterium]|nr:MAG: hypothetical protein EDM80_07750 [bacterium]RIK63583.1 MAG: hypothetical protein DCC64_07010 [Planctomycetota bacterium]